MLCNILGKSTSWYKGSSRRTACWYWNDAKETGRRTAEFVNIVFIIFRIFVKFSLLDSIISSSQFWLVDGPLCIVCSFRLFCTFIIMSISQNLPSKSDHFVHFWIFSNFRLLTSATTMWSSHHCLAQSPGFACSKRYGLQVTKSSTCTKILVFNQFRSNEII